MFVGRSNGICALIVVALLGAPAAPAQDQDDVSRAMDSAATQWSYQVMPDYHGGTVDNATRPV